MDRSWMNHRGINDRKEMTYVRGVNSFLEFAFTNKEVGTKLRCPCLKCNLQLFHDKDTMRIHLVAWGIVRDYHPWVHHGESIDQCNIDDEGSESDTYTNDFHVNKDTYMIGDEGFVPNVESKIVFERGDNEMPKEFHQLIKDLETELYLGCKTYKRLEFILALLQTKVNGNWSDHSFSMLLEILHRAFNYDASFPKSFYETKKYNKMLGLDYTKIDACVNHCALFWKENEGKDNCPKCGVSRWRERSIVQGGDSEADNEGENMVSREPQLVLRHFPLIPRLQRMFVCSKLARHLRWHKDRHQEGDGILRHPSDGKAWKSFSELYPEFDADARNLRLGLATDGFNPGGYLSSRYSIWPVFIVVYNLPPWMCMKSYNTIMPLLIPGPKSPRNDIDIFLEPLIDELKQLWDVGVKTYDSYRKETFDMHAALMWRGQSSSIKGSSS